jgi:putative radical SAM enzyme (TIGR03279 family)
MQLNSSNACQKKQGLKVKKLSKESPFYKAGIRAGDIICSVNNQSVTDELDFHFYTAADEFEMDIIRNEQEFDCYVTRESGEFSQIEFVENPINRCRNRCIFCFIDQMPRGLRQGLYIKDEDLKHSFINGNYVTLTGANKNDLEKIAAIGLSPLYISVHVTNQEIRKLMLGNKRVPDIMEQLQFLKNQHIGFHTQIVVCPGYNDGKVLLATIKDLMKFGDALLSVAVVPVGLTQFRKIPLTPVNRENAQKICDEVSALSDNYHSKDGFRRIFLADEFFIKAGKALPDRNYYEQFPQIENGVGLICKLYEEWKEYRKTLKKSTVKIEKRKKRYLLLTSVSAQPFIKDIAAKLGPLKNVDFDVQPVVNYYFGELVTVAGLLTAKDVAVTAKRIMKTAPYDCVVIPGVMFNYAGFTLDGYSAERLEKLLGKKLRVAGSIDKVCER